MGKDFLLTGLLFVFKNVFQNILFGFIKFLISSLENQSGSFDRFIQLVG